MQITKGLQRCSTAIRTALDAYNQLACTLEPPHPQLDFKEIITYSSFAEFDLLRDTRGNAQTRLWAQPAYWEVMGLYFKRECARYEIKRLHIEIRRLQTSIHNESILYTTTIYSLNDNPSLQVALRKKWSIRSQVNDIHLWRLSELLKSPGFTGPTSAGTRKGVTPTVEQLTETLGGIRVNEEDDEQGRLEDDDTQQWVNDIMDYISSST
jgi:hypothetical protein